jgi:hypothetical protein
MRCARGRGNPMIGEPSICGQRLCEMSRLKVPCLNGVDLTWNRLTTVLKKATASDSRFHLNRDVEYSFDSRQRP